LRERAVSPDKKKKGACHLPPEGEKKTERTKPTKKKKRRHSQFPIFEAREKKSWVLYYDRRPKHAHRKKKEKGEGKKSESPTSPQGKRDLATSQTSLEKKKGGEGRPVKKKRNIPSKTGKGGKGGGAYSSKGKKEESQLKEDFPKT